MGSLAKYTCQDDMEVFSTDSRVSRQWSDHVFLYWMQDACYVIS